MGLMALYLLSYSLDLDGLFTRDVVEKRIALAIEDRIREIKFLVNSDR
jgi:hypothetical protein